MSGIFEWIQPPKHDPSGGTRKRTIELTLDHGDSIVSATLTIVDDRDRPIVEDPVALALLDEQPLQLNEFDFGLIQAGADGDAWGINFKPRYGHASDKPYLLRLRVTLASQPDEPQEDVTYRMLVGQT